MRHCYLVSITALLVALACGPPPPQEAPYLSQAEIDRRKYLKELDLSMARLCSLVQEFYWRHGRMPKSYDEVRERALSVRGEIRFSPTTKYVWKLSKSEDASEEDPFLYELEITGTLADGMTSSEDFELRLEDPNKVWRPYAFIDPDTGKSRWARTSENLADLLAMRIVMCVQHNGEPPPNLKSVSHGLATDDLNDPDGSSRFEFTFYRKGDTAEITITDRRERVRYRYPWHPVTNLGLPNQINVPRVERY